MPINPFQTLAEMGWGQYHAKKSGAIDSPKAMVTLANQGHRGGKVGAPGPTTRGLMNPQAGGRMPEGNASIGRPNYGNQQPQQPPQRQGRRASFGGMGAGATKGGGGMTAGGDIKFDLSVGKTDYRGANMAGARIGASGMGARTSDSNLGDIDQSQSYAPETTGPKGGSSRGGAGAPGKGGAGGIKSGAGSGPGGAGGAGRGGAGGNAARGGDAGDMRTDNSGVTFGSPVVQIGRNRLGSPNISSRSDTRTTATLQQNTGGKEKTPAPKNPAQKKSAPKNAEKPPYVDKGEQRGRLKASKATWAAVDAGAQREKESSAPKEDPKAETKKKEKIKETAKKSVDKAVQTSPPPALTRKDKKKSSKKK